jgi:peptide deformylase
VRHAAGELVSKGGVVKHHPLIHGCIAKMITIMAHMMGAAISAPKIALTQSNLLMSLS